MSRICGAVDGRVVDLIQNSVRAGEPDPARRRVGRPHRIFHARSPARLQTRRCQTPRPAAQATGTWAVRSFWVIHAMRNSNLSSCRVLDARCMLQLGNSKLRLRGRNRSERAEAANHSYLFASVILRTHRLLRLKTFAVSLAGCSCRPHASVLPLRQCWIARPSWARAPGPSHWGPGIAHPSPHEPLADLLTR